MLKNINHVKIVALIIWVCLLFGFSNYIKYPSIFYPEYQTRTLSWDWYYQNNQDKIVIEYPKLPTDKVFDPKRVSAKTEEFSDYYNSDEAIKLNENEQKIWSRYLQLCPTNYCQKIDKFKIQTNRGFTETPLKEIRGITEVFLRNPVLDNWTLDTNISILKDLDYILTHEIGHIVALNNTQIDQTQHQDFLEALDKETSCQTYSVIEGCSFANSHINQFYQKFWKELEIEQQKV